MRDLGAERELGRGSFEGDGMREPRGGSQEVTGGGSYDRAGRRKDGAERMELRSREQ